MQPFEKLGAFYLGRRFDIDRGAVEDDLLLYDAKDLTTHAVCVGMTGSGKTGLCLSLLEEAAIDGIPAIAIDPKGDLGNLLLSFPKLQPADFRPWIDPSEAARKGMNPDQYAQRVAGIWKKGLADWGQDGQRIANLRAAVDMAIYTPGSEAGLPLSVLRSFKAPPPAQLEDGDALRERIGAAVSGLLAMLGLEADPIRSREHILLANILHHHWSEGRDLDLSGLIRQIQDPPFKQVGVFDLDSFFGPGDRMQLAMTLNNLLASPGFAVWMKGKPLDIPGLLWTPEGKPRLSIISISHLSESERMFFVTILLSEVLAWVRTQPGTPSLRALLYMDEVFGFFPPTANPPAKVPMLTLLKQARAYGLGIVLATQNPVDLDYKGLSNTGTWFLGRLQTERDKARVLDGLEGATVGSGFDRGRIEAVLSGLRSRVFLMNNVHDDGPMLFHTRWAMSYLRGPLTRVQIKTLSDPLRTDTTPPAAAPPPGVAAPAGPAPTMVAEKNPADSAPPVLPAKVPQVFVVRQGALRDGDHLLYRPALVGKAALHFANRTGAVDLWRDVALLAPLDPDEPNTDPWGAAEVLNGGGLELEDDAESGARFAAVPSEAARVQSYKRWTSALKGHLYRDHSLNLWRCASPKGVSEPGESEGEFRVRLTQMAREKRDLKLEKLRTRYTPKLARINERIRKAEQKVTQQQSQYKQQRTQTVISLGSTILGALFGRKIGVGSVGRAATTARGAGRMSREKGDIGRATQDLRSRQQDLAELEKEFEEQVSSLRESVDPASFVLTDKRIRTRKGDMDISQLALAWTPWIVSPDGLAKRAFGST